MEGMTSLLKSPIRDVLKGCGFVSCWWPGTLFKVGLSKSQAGYMKAIFKNLLEKQQIFHALMFPCICWSPSIFFPSNFLPSTSPLLSESKPQLSPGRESTFLCVCVWDNDHRLAICAFKNVFIFWVGCGVGGVWGGQWLSLFACLQCLLHGVLVQTLLWTTFPQCQHFWP